MESVRPRLIAILNRIAASAEDHVVFAEQATLDEIRLVAQLIDDGYLAGKYVRNARGPCNAVVTGITLNGRTYVEQLERDEKNATPKDKIKKWVVYALIYLGGILTLVLAQALIKWLHLD